MFQFDNKIDKLIEKVKDIDRTLCRIEGILSAHGFCLLSQCKPEHKIEKGVKNNG